MPVPLVFSTATGKEGGRKRIIRKSHAVNIRFLSYRYLVIQRRVDQDSVSPDGPMFPGLSGRLFFPNVSLKVLATSGMCRLCRSKWPSPVIQGCFKASDALYLSYVIYSRIRSMLYSQEVRGL
jgi:hypothetical protein